MENNNHDSNNQDDYTHDDFNNHPWIKEDRSDDAIEPFLDEDIYSSYYSRVFEMEQMSSTVVKLGWIDNFHTLSPKDIIHVEYTPPDCVNACREQLHNPYVIFLFLSLSLYFTS